MSGKDMSDKDMGDKEMSDKDISGKEMSGENQEMAKNCVIVYNTRKHIDNFGGIIP